MGSRTPSDLVRRPSSMPKRLSVRIGLAPPAGVAARDLAGWVGNLSLHALRAEAGDRFDGTLELEHDPQGRPVLHLIVRGRRFAIGFRWGAVLGRAIERYTRGTVAELRLEHEQARKQGMIELEVRDGAPDPSFWSAPALQERLPPGPSPPR